MRAGLQSVRTNRYAARITVVLGVAAALLATARAGPTSSGVEPFPVSIRVNASASLRPLKPIWRFFGADEPNYAYMPHGEKLIAAQGKLAPGRVFFRAHNLLTTGDGSPSLKWGSTNAYTEDANGNPVYDWRIVDRIVDTYLKHGVRPYVEIGFMPQALSVKPQPYRHLWTPHAKYDEIYTGWAYPPTDYRKWGQLVYEWARHSVERYGRDEVEQWYWETWNEANIGYWQGTPEEFWKLHDYAIDGVRRALPNAKVGGPDAAGDGGAWMRRFLEHQLRGKNFATGEAGTPIDFVSFHAKGRPDYVDGHVRMGIAAHLATIDEGFRIVAAYPELRGKPIVIGESDPEGCAACQGPQLRYRNTTMYSSYTAAAFARKHDLAARHGVNLEGALTWAFEFEDQPYFAGFRALASNGIPLPVFNVFRMFSRMGAQQVEAASDGARSIGDILTAGVREQPDVGVLASRDARRITILAWHYHDDDVPGPAANVTMTVEGLGASDAMVRHLRVDAQHGNAYTAWLRMGSPETPSREQYVVLERASELAELQPPTTLSPSNGRSEMQFALPRQAVSLLIVEW